MSDCNWPCNVLERPSISSTHCQRYGEGIRYIWSVWVISRSKSSWRRRLTSSAFFLSCDDVCPGFEGLAVLLLLWLLLMRVTPTLVATNSVGHFASRNAWVVLVSYICLVCIILPCKLLSWLSSCWTCPFNRWTVTDKGTSCPPPATSACWVDVSSNLGAMVETAKMVRL